jgi:hypothetical protein
VFSLATTICITINRYECTFIQKERQLKHVSAIIKLATVCAVTLSAALAVAAQGNSADELLNDAERILQQFDSNRYAEVWQDAAPFVKTKIPQDQFVKSTGGICAAADPEPGPGRALCGARRREMSGLRIGVTIGRASCR